MSRITNWKATAFSAVLLLAVSAPLLNAASPAQPPSTPFQHVLLVSIDGMHAVDYLNCSQGVKGVNGGQPYCSNLAKLGATAVNYLDTSTSRPSDSFPGLMAIVTGGTPRTHGRVLRCRLRPGLRSSDQNYRQRPQGWTLYCGPG